MAPKKNLGGPTPRSRVSVKTKIREEEAKEDMLKKDQSNFSTQLLKAEKDGTISEDQMHVWAKYRSLGRFDKEKRDLIAQWKQDRSCKWIQHYSRSSEKASSVEQSTVSGWGTRPSL